MSAIFNIFDKVLAGQDWRVPSTCNCIVIRSVAGAVSIRLNGGDAVPVRAGDKFKADAGEIWKAVSVGGIGSVVAVYGYGDLQNNSSGGGDVNNNVNGTADDPNGLYYPPDRSQAAFYTKDGSNPVVLFFWSVSGQNWIPALS